MQPTARPLITSWRNSVIVLSPGPGRPDTARRAVEVDLDGPPQPSPSGGCHLVGAGGIPVVDALGDVLVGDAVLVVLVRPDRQIEALLVVELVGTDRGHAD